MRRRVRMTLFSSTSIALAFVLAIGIGVTRPAVASQREEVCVKYQTEIGWSHGYAVQGNVVQGSELNVATGSFQYDSFSTYVVVFWAQGEASILKVDFPYLSPLDQSATDQYGRQWEVSAGGVCY